MLAIIRKSMPVLAGIGLMLALNAATGACRHNVQPPPASVGSVPLAMLRAALADTDGPQSPEAVWIGDENQWESLLAQDAAHPEVDFARYGVLLVRMGEKPTGGYGLQLAGDTAQIDGGVATVPVQWTEPEAGSITVQVITSPYLLVRMAKGPYDSIAVADQDGRVRLRLPLEGSRP